MTSACGSDNYVCILGDFNAQTADLEDFTKNDTFLSEHFHFDQQTDDFFDQNCALVIIIIIIIIIVVVILLL